MPPDDLGPDDYELLARLASGYYDDGLTQAGLAREFGLSRQKVQRMLDRARETGVVEIRISAPPWLQLDLERRVRDRFGLTEAIVAAGPPRSRRPARGGRARRGPLPRAPPRRRGRCRRQPRPGHRRGAPLLPAGPSHGRHVRERDGRLPAHGRPDQPERDRAQPGRAQRWHRGRAVRAGLRPE